MALEFCTFPSGKLMELIVDAVRVEQFTLLVIDDTAVSVDTVIVEQFTLPDMVDTAFTVEPVSVE